MTAIWKKLFVAAIAVWLVSFCGSAFAQRRIPVFGTLTVGPSFALGDFARQNPYEGAYAKTGVNLKLSGGVLLTKNFGVQLMASATFTPMDDPYWGGDAKYNYSAVLIGPVVSLPFSNSLSLDLRPSIGIVRQQLNVGFATDAYGNGLAIDLGASLKYFLSSVWFLTFEADYFTSKIDYHNGYRNISTKTLNLTFGGGFFF